MTRAFRVVAAAHEWIIVAPDGLAALAQARELHRENWDAEEAPERYPGFPTSFEVKSLGIVDATVNQDVPVG